jgi:hypothetical protein
LRFFRSYEVFRQTIFRLNLQSVHGLYLEKSLQKKPSHPQSTRPAQSQETTFSRGSPSKAATTTKTQKATEPQTLLSLPAKRHHWLLPSRSEPIATLISCQASRSMVTHGFSCNLSIRWDGSSCLLLQFSPQDFGNRFRVCLSSDLSHYDAHEHAEGFLPQLVD